MAAATQIARRNQVRLTIQQLLRGEVEDSYSEPLKVIYYRWNESEMAARSNVLAIAKISETLRCTVTLAHFSSYISIVVVY